MRKSEFTQKQLNALHIVSLDLAKPGELDAALQVTMNHLSKRLGMKRGMISILRRDLDEIHTVVAVGMEPDQFGHVRYQVGEGITGKVVETGRPVAVPRVENDPMFLDKTG